MAEGVQFQLERQVEELEQMVHCGLFSQTETSAIVKKRKSYEYRVHRQTKSKDDYLNYIRYESALLALLRKRREKTGYAFRLKEIDHAILNRVHSLFRAALKRFQGDVGLWFTYIQFCKEKRNRAMVSRAFSDMLAIHNLDPSIWIMAAQWELEENADPETARGLLQRGLRFLSESTSLWKEYLRMELIHMEKMRTRMRGLRRDGEEEEEEIAKFEKDPVLSGKIVEVVFRRGIEDRPEDVDLLFAFLDVAVAFRTVLPALERWVFEELRNRHSGEPRAWDAMARKAYSAADAPAPPPVSVPGGEDAIDVERRRVTSVEDRESAARRVYEEALSALPGNAEMRRLVVDFAVERLEGGGGEPSLRRGREEFVLKTLKDGEAEDSLDDELRLRWVKILRNAEEGEEEVEPVLRRSLKRFPSSAPLWSELLERKINEASWGDAAQVEKTLKDAVANIKERDSWRLWETYLDWISRTTADDDAVDAVYRRACRQTGREASALAKEEYARHAAAKGGFEELMRVYRWLKTLRPHSIDYFRFVVGVATEAGADDAAKEIHADAAEEFGAENVDVWIEWEKFEEKKKCLDSGRIYGKALRKLKAKLIPEFETKHALFKTGQLDKLSR